MVGTGALLLSGFRLHGRLACRTTLALGVQFRSSARSFSLVAQRSNSRNLLSYAPRGHKLTVFAVRNASTSTGGSGKVIEHLQASAPAELPLPSDAVSGVTEPVISAASDVVNATINSVPPLQYGDLASMGLTGFSPAGFVRWSLEVINVTTHLPWFYTIIAGSLFWKLLTLYPNINAARSAAIMAPYQGELTKLREQSKIAGELGDRLTQQKCAVRIKAITGQANILKTMVNTIIQVPLSFGIFFGVRSLCNLPLVQMMNSGSAWLPDLTVPDPTYVLPVLFIASANFLLYVMKTDSGSAASPSTPHVMNIMQLFSIIPAYLSFGWGSGLTLALTATSVFQTIQTLVLRNPSVRAKLSIPPYVRVKPKSFSETFVWAKDSLKGQFTSRLAEAERKAVLQRIRGQEGKARLRRKS